MADDDDAAAVPYQKNVLDYDFLRFAVLASLGDADNLGTLYDDAQTDVTCVSKAAPFVGHPLGQSLCA
jgi:hypothetical protein